MTSVADLTDAARCRPHSQGPVDRHGESATLRCVHSGICLTMPNNV
jgi:hypothetical protein